LSECRTTLAVTMNIALIANPVDTMKVRPVIGDVRNG
jgi:hypothetical protein